MYPHYLCGKGKEGNYVYYERPGEIEIPQLNARGIGIDEMLRHWLFVTEYQYTHVGLWTLLLLLSSSADLTSCFSHSHAALVLLVVVVTGEMEKAITVIDIEQVKMSDVAGDALEFVRRSVGIANQHYPERSFVFPSPSLTFPLPQSIPNLPCECSKLVLFHLETYQTDGS
jgi:hypothetical protein